MVLISIRPFALRKLFVIIVALLCFSAVCFADPVLMVRRYAFHAGRVAAARVSVWQEPAGSGRARIVDSYFAHFESADLAECQPEIIPIDGGKRGRLPATTSCVFRDASCALHSSGPITIPDGPALRDSAEI